MVFQMSHAKVIIKKGTKTVTDIAKLCERQNKLETKPSVSNEDCVQHHDGLQFKLMAQRNPNE